jgi:hypothetical protein
MDRQLRQRIIAHILRQIEDLRVESNPFPHFVTAPFFPPDVYDALVKRLPRPEFYENFHYDKHSNGDGQSNRQRFRLENADLFQLEPAQRTFWSSIRSALGSPELRRCVFQKLSEGLAYRFHCDACDVEQQVPGFALPELFREIEGYRIAPHPDTRKKVVTMQIALPEDDRQADLGTEFYQRSLSPLSWLREPKGFNIVKVMPFLPNTAYAFVVLNTMRIKSWHGRSQLRPACGIRNSLLNIWYTSAEHANQAIVMENEPSAGLRRAA